ncbi:MAG: hypothetical protein WCC12_05220, partial [Anaerolineales bacterium]
PEIIRDYDTNGAAHQGKHWRWRGGRIRMSSSEIGKRCRKINARQSGVIVFFPGKYTLRANASFRASWCAYYREAKSFCTSATAFL